MRQSTLSQPKSTSFLELLGANNFRRLECSVQPVEALEGKCFKLSHAPFRLRTSCPIVVVPAHHSPNLLPPQPHQHTYLLSLSRCIATLFYAYSPRLVSLHFFPPRLLHRRPVAAISAAAVANVPATPHPALPAPTTRAPAQALRIDACRVLQHRPPFV